MMETKRIEEIRERNVRAEDRNYNMYQNTGITRYNTARRAAGELVELCDLALDAAPTAHTCNDLRGELSRFGYEANYLLHNWSEDKARRLLQDLAHSAESRHLIRDHWREG